MPRSPLPSLACALLSIAAGCTPAQTGALGGTFTYLCTSRGDVTCGLVEGQATPPAQVALGGWFGLGFTPPDGAADAPVTIVPAAPTMVATGSLGFLLVQPKPVAFLARTQDGTVVDFIHLVGTPVDHADVSAPGSGVAREDFAVRVSARLTLAASPRDAAGQPLAGAPTYWWTSSDPTVASILHEQDDTVTLLGIKAGTTTLNLGTDHALAHVRIDVGAP